MACIYCNNIENLNETHIIPDAITNSNIKYSNSVCAVQHNSVFGETFENDVISKLGTIINHLDIKSSKNNKNIFAEFKIIFKVNEVDFQMFVNDISSDLVGNKVIQSIDGNYIYGKKIILDKKGGDLKKIYAEEFEISNFIINQDLEVFLSNSMFRLVSKIAYEWFCYENRIDYKIDEFDEIINFIINGGENKFVSIIYEENCYNHINNYSTHGSHMLFSYIENNNIKVVVSLFGVAIYRINLGEYDYEKLRNKFLFRECTIYGFFRRFGFQNIYNGIMTHSCAIYNVKTQEVKTLEEIEEKRYTSENVYLYIYISFNCNNLVKVLNIKSDEELKLLHENRELNPTFSVLSNNVNRLLSIKVISLRGLKRCIKKYNLHFEIKNGINIEAHDLYKIYIMYLVFDDIDDTDKINDIETLNKNLKAKLKDSILVNDNIKGEIDRIFAEDKMCFAKIIKVARIINSWS